MKLNNRPNTVNLLLQKAAFLFLLFNLFILQNGQAQNETNIWYFGDFAGLDFNPGDPVAVPGFTWKIAGTAVMCDSLGNLLFYTDGLCIYNRNHDTMANGNLEHFNDCASQQCLIVPKPESENIYYLFIIGGEQQQTWGDRGFWYSVIDMDGDNGLGEVIEDEVSVPAGWDGAQKLFGLKQPDSKNIWIVIHKTDENKYASFLLTPQGFNPNPVLSNSTVDLEGYDTPGYLKVSFDKKYIVSVFSQINTQKKGDLVMLFEIGKFDAKTGKIDDLYTITEYNFSGNGFKLAPYGAEFSPDSKYLYVSFQHGNNFDEGNYIYQYDMKYVEDSVLFRNSKLLINNGPPNPGMGLQLARDGQIYVTMPEGANMYDYHYINIIHKPWKRGAACGFEKEFIDTGGSAEVEEGFPDFLLDYLYRFEWDNECSGPTNVVHFKPNFYPEPDSIYWNFDDPASGNDSISYDLYPSHKFDMAGDYEIYVWVHYPPSPLYPMGRIEETSRIIHIKQSPLPDLGPDKMLCQQEEVVLNGGAGNGYYNWSTGESGMNDSLITVSDTGYYWVEVKAPNKCITIDSVRIGINPPARFIEDNLIIIPTACNGSSGSIMGLQVSGDAPFSYEWQDAQGNVLSTQLNISGLPVGNYYLLVTDAHGCHTLSDSYTIVDAGNIIIDTVLTSVAYCGNPDGSLIIAAHSGATTYLRYSVNDGNSYQTNDTFSNLYAGNYIVRVSDTNGCQSVYNNNPVVVPGIFAPEIISVDVIDETNNDANGEIIIVAQVSSGDIRYSLDNGNSFQVNDGHFINLSAGVYTCMVANDFGCDTTFEITVKRLNAQILEALAGDGHSCLGDATVVPLVVSGFDSVIRFRAELFYDSAIMRCSGYQNANAKLPDLQAQLVQNDNKVIVRWNNSTPVSLNENEKLVELVFEAKKEGYSLVDWSHAAGESRFVNANGETINTLYQAGTVVIFTRPEILMTAQQNICEGDMVLFSPYVTGGSGSYTFLWNGPRGFTSDKNLVLINNVQSSMAGNYTFTVTDTAGCVESRTLNLTVEQGPRVSFADKDTLFLNPGELLDAQVQAAAYLWNTGDTLAAISIDSMGQYWLQTTGFNGCKSLDTVRVLWGGIPFFVPNAFTPNGDGLNDVFKAIPLYDYVKDFVLQIYNRWGQQIFESRGSTNGWDGTYQGKPMQQGTYVYRILYRDFQTKETKTVQGTVVVVRR